jgi:hypothetical protein
MRINLGEVTGAFASKALDLFRRRRRLVTFLLFVGARIADQHVSKRMLLLSFVKSNMILFIIMFNRDVWKGVVYLLSVVLSVTSKIHFPFPRKEKENGSRKPVEVVLNLLNESQIFNSSMSYCNSKESRHVHVTYHNQRKCPITWHIL